MPADAGADADADADVDVVADGVADPTAEAGDGVRSDGQAATGAAQLLAVDVACAVAPRVVDVVALRLPHGSTVADALTASGLVQRHGLDADALAAAGAVGVWGRARPLQTPLRDRDRVDICRPLRVDPKEARRLRHQRQRGGGGTTTAAVPG